MPSFHRYFAASLAIVLALLLVRADTTNLEMALGALAGWLTLAGATFGVKCPSRGRPPVEALLTRAAVVIALLAFGALALTHWLTNGHFATVVDETIYLLQARLLDEPTFARIMDPAIAPFFAIRQAAFRDGRMFGQYPPGWPAVLWLFWKMGLRWWTGPAVGAAGVFMTYRLGRRVRSASAGIVAAVLLALNAWFIIVGGSYQSHAADPLLAVTAALLLVHASGITTGREWVRAVTAGGVIGILCATRPVTGAAIGVSLWLWTIVRARNNVPGGRAPDSEALERRSGRFAARLGIAMSLGAAPFIAFVLAYNAIITGHPLTFGYLAANGPIQSYGFGLRGIVDYGLDGTLLDVQMFTPSIAVANAVSRAAELTVLGVGCGVLAPLLLLGRVYRYSMRYRELGCFLVLPAIHFFYFWSNFRFYVVLLPFLYLELGALAEHVYRRAAPQMRRLAFAVVVGSFALAVARTADRRAHGIAKFEVWPAIARLQAQGTRLLLFVDAPPLQATLYQALYTMNIDQFPGSVVVARHRGELDRDLMRRLPGYTPYLVHLTADGPPTIAEYRPSRMEIVQ